MISWEVPHFERNETGSAGRMEGCRSHQLPLGKRAWKTCVAYIALLLLVAAVVLAIALPITLCQPAAGSAMAGSCSAGQAQLQEALDVTNRSLVEAHRQWDSCRKQLGELEGKASEMEQQLARITQLQEETATLRAEVARQQKQLEDLQSSREKLQKELQDMRSQHSGGNGLLAVSLSLLALLLSGMLLL
ncbi:uncharacterized protein WM294_014761 [Sarcoramphus papa]